MRTVTPAQAAAQLRAAAAATNKATRASLESCKAIVLPIMRTQGAAAAGPDRRLSNLPRAGVLGATWDVRGRLGVYHIIFKPKGPWRIRDNSYTGGKTKPHTIVPVNARYLVFEYKGRVVRRTSVAHPGS